MSFMPKRDRPTKNIDYRYYSPQKLDSLTKDIYNSEVDGSSSSASASSSSSPHSSSSSPEALCSSSSSSSHVGNVNSDSCGHGDGDVNVVDLEARAQHYQNDHQHYADEKRRAASLAEADYNDYMDIQSERPKIRTLTELMTTDLPFVITVACLCMSLFVFFLYFYRLLRTARENNRVNREAEQKQQAARSYWREMNRKAAEREALKKKKQQGQDEKANEGDDDDQSEHGHQPSQQQQPRPQVPEDTMTRLKRETRTMAAILDKHWVGTQNLAARLEAAQTAAQKGAGNDENNPNDKNSTVKRYQHSIHDEDDQTPLPPMAGANHTGEEDTHAEECNSETPQKASEGRRDGARLSSLLNSAKNSPQPLHQQQAKTKGEDGAAHSPPAASAPSLRNSPSRGAYIVDGRTTAQLSSDVFGYAAMTAEEQRAHENTFRRIEKKLLIARQERAKMGVLAGHGGAVAPKKEEAVREDDDGKGGEASAQKPLVDPQENIFLTRVLTADEKAFWLENMRKIKAFQSTLREEAAIQWQRRRELIAELRAIAEAAAEDCENDIETKTQQPKSLSSKDGKKLAGVSKRLDLESAADGPRVDDASTRSNVTSMPIAPHPNPKVEAILRAHEER